MQQLFFLLTLAACPLMMVFMMRGMHGGGTHRNDGDQGSVNTIGVDSRVAELEHEVSRLRRERAEARPAAR